MAFYSRNYIVSPAVLAALGVIITITLAVAIYFLSPPTHRWSMMDKWAAREVYDSFYGDQSVSFESLHISRGKGSIGYRIIDILRISKIKDDTGITKWKSVGRQAMITQWGWPFPIVETDARSLGLTKLWQGKPDLPYVGSQEVQTRILWSGLISNAFLFGALMLGIGGGYQIARHGRNRQTVLMFSLGMGFLLPVPVAWSLYSVFNAHLLSREHLSYDDLQSYRSQSLPLDIVPPSEEELTFSGTENLSFGYWNAYYVFNKSIGNRSRLVVGRGQLSLGWPFYVLKNDRAYSHSSMLQVMSTPIFWPGLVANGLIYTLILYAILAGPRELRSLWWSKHGRCEACGYLWGESPRCSECGEPIKRLAQ